MADNDDHNGHDNEDDSRDNGKQLYDTIDKNSGGTDCPKLARARVKLWILVDFGSQVNISFRGEKGFRNFVTAGELPSLL